MKSYEIRQKLSQIISMISMLNQDSYQLTLSFNGEVIRLSDLKRSVSLNSHINSSLIYSARIIAAELSDHFNELADDEKKQEEK